MDNFAFAQPLWLLLILFCIPMWYAYHKKQGVVRFSSTQTLMTSYRSPWLWMRHLPFVLRCTVLILFSLAMARPQTGHSESQRKTEGLDIMLVIDTSGSMKALDFVIGGKRQNRLEVVKKVLAEFINNRPDDRIGTVVFGTNAFAQAPLTLDHDILLRYLNMMEIGMAGEATAIGDSVGVAVNRLKDLKSKSKIIILLTDGENTAGKIEPIEATEAAKALDVKVYTIGVGSKGMVPIPTALGYQKVQVNLDEKLLKAMAEKTGARYFRATDTESLIKIYQTIDRLEKSEVEIKVHHNYDEHFAFFVWPGLLLLLLELGLRLTRIRRLV